MMHKNLNILLTGATGMVGEGVLLQCLNHPDVGSITSISRRPCGISHPKLKEIIHKDFYDLSPILDQLQGFDACLFCLGVSSVGMKKSDYFKNTYTLTMHFAETLKMQNAQICFCYISGAGTDSNEKGTGWASVKGKTENDLVKLLYNAYNFRPGFIKPISGSKHVNKYYKYIGWIFPIGRRLYPKGFCKIEELGNAMIYVARDRYNKRILEGDDIIQLGNL